MKLVVRWKDGSFDEIQLWHKPHAAHWTREAIERLLQVFDSGATQLEIAAAFPDLQWQQLYNEIKKHRGLVRFTPSWLGKLETYREYKATGGRKGKASGSFWRPEEVELLRSMVLRQAPQIEIMQQFPYRRWIQLQERIKVLFGVGTRVPHSGISQKLTYLDYQQQTSEALSGDKRITGCLEDNGGVVSLNAEKVIEAPCANCPLQIGEAANNLTCERCSEKRVSCF